MSICSCTSSQSPASYAALYNKSLQNNDDTNSQNLNKKEESTQKENISIDSSSLINIQA